MILYSKIEGKGQPLLILHGYLGMSDNWKTLGSLYADSGCEVHLLDLRNHGRSFHSDEFNYDVMVQDIFDYCAAYNLESINIIGHSMGGKVAMFFAVKYPQKVNKLVVADIGPKYYDEHHQDIFEGLNAVDFTIKPDRNQVDEILKEHIPDFGTRQFLMKNVYWKEPGQLAFRFNLEVFNKQQNQIGAALPADAIFSKPTLFIRGGNSNYIKDEDFDDMRHHFPVLKIETIPDVGHWLHAENPAVFFEISSLFLK